MEPAVDCGPVTEGKRLLSVLSVIAVLETAPPREFNGFVLALPPEYLKSISVEVIGMLGYYLFYKAKVDRGNIGELATQTRFL